MITQYLLYKLPLNIPNKCSFQSRLPNCWDGNSETTWTTITNVHVFCPAVFEKPKLDNNVISTEPHLNYAVLPKHPCGITWKNEGWIWATKEVEIIDSNYHFHFFFAPFLPFQKNKEFRTTLKWISSWFYFPASSSAPRFPNTSNPPYRYMFVWTSAQINALRRKKNIIFTLAFRRTSFSLFVKKAKRKKVFVIWQQWGNRAFLTLGFVCFLSRFRTLAEQLISSKDEYTKFNLKYINTCWVISVWTACTHLKNAKRRRDWLNLYAAVWSAAFPFSSFDLCENDPVAFYHPLLPNASLSYADPKAQRCEWLVSKMERKEMTLLPCLYFL